MRLLTKYSANSNNQQNDKDVPAQETDASPQDNQEYETKNDGDYDDINETPVCGKKRRKSNRISFCLGDLTAVCLLHSKIRLEGIFNPETIANATFRRRVAFSVTRARFLAN